MYLVFNYLFHSFTKDINVKQLYIFHATAVFAQGSVFHGATEVKVSELYTSCAEEGS